MTSSRITFSSDKFKEKYKEAKQLDKLGRKGRLGKCKTRDCIGQSLYALGWIEKEQLEAYQELINNSRDREESKVWGIKQMYFFLKLKYKKIGLIKYNISDIEELFNDIGYGKVYLAFADRDKLPGHAFLIGKYKNKQGKTIRFIWDNQMTIYGKDKPVFKFRDEVKTYISINKFINISIFRSVKEIKKKIEKISGEQKTKFEYLIKTPDNINDYSINDLYDKNFIESHPIFNDFDVENEKKRLKIKNKQIDKMLAFIEKKGILRLGAPGAEADEKREDAPLTSDEDTEKSALAAGFKTKKKKYKHKKKYKSKKKKYKSKKKKYKSKKKKYKSKKAKTKNKK